MALDEVISSWRNAVCIPNLVNGFGDARRRVNQMCCALTVLEIFWSPFVAACMLLICVNVHNVRLSFCVSECVCV